VKVAGNYTFYIKLIYGNDNMWVVYNGGTGIDEIMNENKAVKVLIDGDVIIIKGGKMYNVLGTLVK
jgi:archaellum component FlaG (FlaF/FlaG flagellin family)